MTAPVSPTSGTPTLDINDAPRFQHWFWRVQRLAWGLLVMLGMAAVGGLTGGEGYFADQTVQGPAFTLEAPSIMRRQANAAITIALTSDAPQAVVQFDRAFADTFQILAMTPPPISAFATTEGAAYRFDLSGPGSKRLHFQIASDNSGRAAYSISTAGQRAQLSTWVLP